MSGKPSYEPPVAITPAILGLVADISVKADRLSVRGESALDLRLRRISQVRSIKGSLAIEGNTLGEEAITAVLDGKRVVAPLREIQEVRNAIAAYDVFEKWTPHDETDLLKAHGLLMAGLIDDAGLYRRGGVGVIAGSQVLHLAPPAKRVPLLMGDLLDWLSRTWLHPLVAGSVFHYEFEFIHPFTDGNGRLGRLWQTLILCRWNPCFVRIPVESIVHAHQEEYYQALREATNAADSAPFVEFMLAMILEALESAASPQVAPQVSPQVKRLLEVLSGEMSGREIMEALGLTDRKSFRQRYLAPALDAGLVEMTIPDKPNSHLQRYRLAGT
ncbi:MAG: Fic family protein [Deltaproteobacteria bacterium]|nr:Fic family protein [Deltaproteobacteria bacterium]